MYEVRVLYTCTMVMVRLWHVLFLSIYRLLPLCCVAFYFVGVAICRRRRRSFYSVFFFLKFSLKYSFFLSFRLSFIRFFFLVRFYFDIIYRFRCQTSS